MSATSSLRQATLVFLIRRQVDGGVGEICLAMKKRGFGVGRWNGVGGKFDAIAGDTTIESAASREMKEEISVASCALAKVAVLDFFFPHNPSFNQQVHAYFCESWQGEPTESAEMAPRWYKIADIPYDKMWPDDIFWLPKVLEGKKLKARFSFGEGDKVLEQHMEEVASF